MKSRNIDALRSGVEAMLTKLKAYLFNLLLMINKLTLWLITINRLYFT